MSVTRKTEIEPIDGTPVKRMFWSIINDYDLKSALCELIDNALDVWLRAGGVAKTKIEIWLDADRQLITIKDHSGGVRVQDLKVLVAPGGSGNDPASEIIGIFGVGSKRAGIALGEHIEIRTRFSQEQSLQIDITRDWLSTEDWEIAAYEIPDIDPSSTEIRISQLRSPFIKEGIGDFRAHVGETYAWYLQHGVVIEVNGTEATPITFDSWAFPPDYAPRSAKFRKRFDAEGEVSFDVTVGLIRDRIADAGNYGAYIYCNDRLIVKELKSRDVGYVPGSAGVPHPDASLCRGIVRLRGPAKLMPWNSTKNDIVPTHAVFEFLRPTLVQLMAHFSTLSRRFQGGWEQNAVRFQDGAVEAIEPAGSNGRSSLILPPVPRAHRGGLAELKSANAPILKARPWLLGLIESISVVDVLKRQKLQTKNRIALIVLDSNFEIALKEFLVHRHDLFPKKDYPDGRIKYLFSKRHLVINEVTQKIAIPQDLLDVVAHYYEWRNKLIHERATNNPPDADIVRFRSAIEEILALLFDLKFQE